MVYNEKDKSKWTKDDRHWYFRISCRDAKEKNSKLQNTINFFEKLFDRLIKFIKD